MSKKSFIFGLQVGLTLALAAVALWSHEEKGLSIILLINVLSLIPWLFSSIE